MVIGDARNATAAIRNPSIGKPRTLATNFTHPRFRYLMSVHVADHTNQLWLQAFNEVGEVIMGMPAKELYEIEVSATGLPSSNSSLIGLQQRDHEEAQRTIAKAHCKSFNFACRGKQDNWGVSRCLDRARGYRTCLFIRTKFVSGTASTGRLSWITLLKVERCLTCLSRIDVLNPP